jgi:hypothetical protein
MHIPEDPQVYVQSANAFKAIFDSLRSAIGMVRELRGKPDGGSEKEKALIDAALDKGRSGHCYCPSRSGQGARLRNLQM